MGTGRPASRSPASAALTCRKSTEPMYESLVMLRRAHQLSARPASMRVEQEDDALDVWTRRRVHETAHREKRVLWGRALVVVGRQCGQAAPPS